MAGMIARGLAGAGEAMERAGFAWLQKELDEAKAVRLEELRAGNQSARDDKLLGHQSAEAEKSRTHASAEAGLTREHAAGLQKTALEHAASEHAKTREHQSGEAAATRAHQTLEGDKTREIQRAGVGLQAARLGIEAKGAALDQQIKEIQIKNAKDLDAMKESYRTETDPEKKAQIADNIRILTGKDKDKYLPVPLKDDMGNVVGYEIFDTIRGKFVESKASPKPKPGNGERPSLDSFFGKDKPKDRPAPPKTEDKAPPVTGSRAAVDPTQIPPPPKPESPRNPAYVEWREQYGEQWNSLTPRTRMGLISAAMSE